ncbi:MAG TPA: ABC transporter permease [Candidatus Excrementavichristensenella intestinipullorum]|nr:ABC transporter permease [Candidatus Excrementavichristensenella intestinipullorum]
MGKYILKRFLWIIPVILCVSVFVFTLMYFTPGDPAQIILGTNATEEMYEAKREELGLNDPYIVQLSNFLKNVFLRGDLGTSYKTQQDVLEQVMIRMPYTMKLAFGSVILSILVGIPLGVIAATNQYSWKDNLSMFAALFSVSMPSFWFALLLVMLFSLNLRWLPSTGADTILHYIMPCVSVAVGGAAGIARQTRSSMLEVIRQDYITTARAKGMKERAVIYKVALKNALIPVVTVIGMQIAGMFGGSLVSEVIFSIPGVGSYILNAITTRDYPTVRGGVLIISICFCLIMLLVDIAYAMIDPRIRAQYEK